MAAARTRPGTPEVEWADHPTVFVHQRHLAPGAEDLVPLHLNSVILFDLAAAFSLRHFTISAQQTGRESVLHVDVAFGRLDKGRTMGEAVGAARTSPPSENRSFPNLLLTKRNEDAGCSSVLRYGYRFARCQWPTGRCGRQPRHSKRQSWPRWPGSPLWSPCGPRRAALAVADGG